MYCIEDMLISRRIGTFQSWTQGIPHCLSTLSTGSLFLYLRNCLIFMIYNNKVEQSHIKPLITANEDTYINDLSVRIMNNNWILLKYAN